ncbi:DMT family transporter [Roseibium sp.]|uniref:DMT family transporter n=1 Tax=Roseibium sp. TaxID=1936156 RepID=UPI003A982039
MTTNVERSVAAPMKLRTNPDYSKSIADKAGKAGTPEKTKGVFEAFTLLLVVGTLLAGSTVVARMAPAAGWSSLPLLQWSLLLAATLQAAVIWGRRSGSASSGTTAAENRASLVRYMLVSGILFAVPNAIAFTAVLHVGAGFVALCFAFPLVLTYALAVSFRLEVVKGRRIAGVVLGVLGGIAMVAGGLASSPGNLFWALAALSMPVIIALGNIYRTLYWPEGAQPELLSSGMMGAGFLVLVPVTLALGQAALPSDGLTLFASALLALQTGQFTLLYALYFRLQKLAGPVFLSQIGSVAAVAGLILAFVLFGEVPDLAKLIAVALVGAGIALVSGRR